METTTTIHAYVAVLIWGGLYLRDELIPLRRYRELGAPRRFVEREFATRMSSTNFFIRRRDENRIQIKTKV